MFCLVGSQRRELGILSESVDMCVNPHCPGQVDVQVMFKETTICYIPTYRSRNGLYISCNVCDYIDRAENYEKHRRQRGDIGYTLPVIEKQNKREI